LISYDEIVPHGVELTEGQAANVSKLLHVMNQVRADYGLPMRVTSGFRTTEMEKRIDPVHPQSAHTRGEAVDILDPDPERRLWTWCIDNLEIITELGLYLESRVYSKNHVHFQTCPPESGNRVFIP
jgi:uncharacterized protein YcbK (DUF882 family)